MYNWVTRRKQPRTEGSSYPTRVVQTVDAVVAKLIPITAALLACAVTPARPKLDVRSYDWQPAFTWVRPVVDATVRTYIPATNADRQSSLAPARPSLDVRRFEWTPEAFDLVTRVDAQVRTWVPAFAPASARTQPGRLDVRFYDWTADEGSWIAATQTASATVAQTAPAWVNHSTSYRTQTRASLDLTTVSGPTFVRTPEDWAYWTPQQDTGGRTRDRARLDVRAIEWAPGAFSLVARVDAAVQTWGPAFSTELSSTRTVAAPVLDVRRPDWTAPSSSWTATPVTATISQWGPVFSSALAGTRTNAGPSLDVRTPQAQQIGWLTAPVVSTLAQQWAAVLEGTGQSYRTPTGVTLDVRRFEWTPEAFDLVTRVDAQTRTWSPAFTASSERVAARRGRDVRFDQWHVDDAAWITATQTPAVSVAETSAAWSQSQHFRTASRAVLLLSREVSSPNQFRTPEDWAYWTPPLQDHGGSTRDRVTLDVRTDWAPAFAWVQPVTDATVARFAGVFTSELAGIRTADRARLDVHRGQWELYTVAPPATTAQLWPAFLQNLGTQDRTRPSATLDPRLYGWTSFAPPIFVRFGDAFVATLLSTDPTLTVGSSTAALTVDSTTPGLTVDSSTAVLMVRDGNAVYGVEFTA